MIGEGLVGACTVLALTAGSLALGKTRRAASVPTRRPRRSRHPLSVGRFWDIAIFYGASANAYTHKDNTIYLVLGGVGG